MPAAVLTREETESVRFHLGYGNLQVGAYPWTPDGFFELFTNVLAVYLSDGLVTSSTTSISVASGPAVVVVTPAAMSGTLGDGTTSSITAGQRLIVDCDDDAEIVVVKAVTATTFSARFAKTHTSDGYPVAVESGTARLRYLLHRADRVHEQAMGSMISAVAGIQSVDKGEVVYFGRSGILKATFDQYAAIVAEMASLLRVPPVQIGGGGGARMEAY
jgi:hypothetical protein